MIRREKICFKSRLNQVVPTLIVIFFSLIICTGSPGNGNEAEIDGFAHAVQSRVSLIVLEIPDECDQWSLEFLINADNDKTCLTPDVPDGYPNSNQGRKKPRAVIPICNKFKEAPLTQVKRPQPVLSFKYFILIEEPVESRFSNNIPHNRPPPLQAEKA